MWADLGCWIDIDLDHEINTSFSVSIGNRVNLSGLEKISCIDSYN